MEWQQRYLCARKPSLVNWRRKIGRPGVQKILKISITYWWVSARKTKLHSSSLLVHCNATCFNIQMAIYMYRKYHCEEIRLSYLHNGIANTNNISDLLVPVSLYWNSPLAWPFDRSQDCTISLILTHWGWVTHICVSQLITVVSDNGLSPYRRQAFIWINDGILLFGPVGRNFSEILIAIYTFPFKKMHLKMLSGKWRPSRPQCVNTTTWSPELNGCHFAATFSNAFPWKIIVFWFNFHRRLFPQVSNKVQWQWQYRLLATRFPAYPECRWAHSTKRSAFYVD